MLCYRIQPCIFDVQIGFNGLPALPKNPMARFFGGEEIEDMLSSNNWKSNRMFLHLSVTIACQLLQIVVKNFHGRRFATSYMNNMRANALNNFLNIFSSKVSIISFIIAIVLEAFNLSQFGVLEDKYLLARKYILVVYFVVLLVSCLPYSGYPLR